MTRKLLLIAVLLLPGCYVGPSNPSGPTPSPDVPQPSVSDDWGFSSTLPAQFTGKRQLAADVAAVCNAFADRVEFDGKQGEPNIVSSTDVALVFAECMSFDLLGGDPALGPFADTISNALSKELEPDNEAVDLSSDQRRRVVQMFQAMAQALRGGK
ncbi:hypothetical protein [Gimesia fumaroli]|uniref:Lipoprotein n=1 Tax=Gimesia fumaroli TaxID=2527976 RepID=A0A518I926_9PLAN|nr:hypothetical protein [Gimesia fumaroli]QDV49564.1 hypothetical protein Enr17x_15840 [Gimesia fumaroli]